MCVLSFTLPEAVSLLPTTIRFGTLTSADEVRVHSITLHNLGHRAISVSNVRTSRTDTRLRIEFVKVRAVVHSLLTEFQFLSENLSVYCFAEHHCSANDDCSRGKCLLCWRGACASSKEQAVGIYQLLVSTLSANGDTVFSAGGAWKVDSPERSHVSVSVGFRDSAVSQSEQLYGGAGWSHA